MTLWRRWRGVFTRAHSAGGRHRHLFWRIFLHGLLQIVAVVLLSALVFHLVGQDRKWRRMPERLAKTLAARLAASGAPQTELQQLLDELKQIALSEAAVYTVEGEPLASTGTAAPRPLPREEALALGGQRTVRTRAGRRALAVSLPVVAGQPRAYLVMQLPGGGGARLALWLLVVLAAVALFSIPLVHAIARPLERITSTAHQLGRGDLSARTGLQRRDEVGILARTLDEMAERLGARMRAEKELLANVSHELRTPLSRIAVALELCAEPDASADAVRQQLEGIAGDVGELERLLDDVLAAARLDLAGLDDKDGAGALTLGSVLRRSPLRIAEVLDQAARRFRVAHPQRDLALESAAELPAVSADGPLIRRMVDNLLDNAAKYSDPSTRVRLVATPCAGGIEIAVEDRGIGVPEEHLARLFDPFFRAESSRARSAGGTGLGLTLCRRIAQAHGGTIEAQRREGGGMVFRAVLPLDRA